MITFDFSSAQWRKSSRSSQSGDQCVEVAAVWRKSSHSSQDADQCVEVAGLDHVVAVRDSKDPDGPKLTFSPREWRAFTNDLR